MITGFVARLLDFVYSKTAIDPRDKDNLTPLLSAARMPSRDIVRALVDDGASLRNTEKLERNVIHLAAQHQQERVLRVRDRVLCVSRRDVIHLVVQCQ